MNPAIDIKQGEPEQDAKKMATPEAPKFTVEGTQSKTEPKVDSNEAKVDPKVDSQTDRYDVKTRPYQSQNAKDKARMDNESSQEKSNRV